jgi:hypothetical protein
LSLGDASGKRPSGCPGFSRRTMAGSQILDGTNWPRANPSTAVPKNFPTLANKDDNK